MSDQFDGLFQGIQRLKAPNEVLAYPKLIELVRPRVIIETGTKFGGGALWFASMLESLKMDNSFVITIDISGTEYCIPHNSLIKRIIGSSVDENIFTAVKRIIKDNAPVMVSLDAEHTRKHVEKELSLYYQLVSKGSYLVVEDTNQGDVEFAVYDFIARHPEFSIDRQFELHPHTTNKNGFLLRS
jgi:cephalosporin hydroxylase